MYELAVYADSVSENDWCVSGAVAHATLNHTKNVSDNIAVVRRVWCRNSPYVSRIQL